MQRIILGIEYDGSRFAGWQWQTGRPTVQAALEDALSKIANEPVNVVCAGRTDAGVHALEQPSRSGTCGSVPDIFDVASFRNVGQKSVARPTSVTSDCRAYIHG